MRTDTDLDSDQTMELRSRHRLYVIAILVFILLCFSGVAVQAWRMSKKYFSETGVVPAAQRFLESGSAYYICDSIAGHVHRPNVAIDVDWTEHPDGHLVMKTNNLGFREDADTPETKPAGLVRVLVTGDSHIDGVVNNAESFPNQLEELLNGPYGLSGFEVDNCGTGHYGPHNYVGCLKKYVCLKPDVYLVVFYIGNDFMDAVMAASREDESLSANLKTGRLRRLAYIARLLLARRICHGGVSQVLNSAFFFEHFPRMRETALTVCQQQVEAIREVCLARDIGLIVVLLPARSDIRPAITDWRFNTARWVLSLDAADLAINRDLADSLATWLRLSGIECVDLIAHMDGQAGEDLFWKQDWHLNHRGHRAAAEAVYVSCQAVFESAATDY